MPDVNNLIALCRVFDKTLEDFVEGADEYLKSNQQNKNNKKSNKLDILKLVILSVVVLYLVIAVFKVLLINGMIQKIEKYKDSNDYSYNRENYSYDIKVYSSDGTSEDVNVEGLTLIYYKNNWQKIMSYSESSSYPRTTRNEWYYISENDPDDREIYIINEDGNETEYRYIQGFDYSYSSPYKLAFNIIDGFNEISFILNPFKIIKFDFENKDIIFESMIGEESPTTYNKYKFYISITTGLLKKYETFDECNELKSRTVYYDYKFNENENYEIEPSEEIKKLIKANSR